ncbi:MAG: hypothetical protein HYZ28_18055 [Myxococcales bacterium]|nr:hypothetical protein [Myxococcales bacterium]
MTEEAAKAREQSAELVIPGGCLLCGRDLPIRVTSSGAYACCSACRWISRPHLKFSREGLTVAYTLTGQA